MSATGDLRITPVGPEAAGDVLAVVRAAFAARPPLDPPTEALAETEESIARLLAGGGLLARLDGAVVGAVALDPAPEADGEVTVYLRRFGVHPDAQGRGVATALVAAALARIAEGGELGTATRVVVLAREELPRTIGFWRDMGFVETARHAPYVELAHPVPVAVDVPDADAMRALGERLAAVLGAGDLLVLTGGLGAGKTTFTQGLGHGLGVRGQVTSPTFVISRVHPPLDDDGRPALVHVDAYRLGGAAELDDLDLDTDLAEAVTVVEWGSGLAEALAEDRLEVRILRATGADAVPVETEEPDEPDDEPVDPRRVEIDPVGARWLGVDLRGVLTD